MKLTWGLLTAAALMMFCSCEKPEQAKINWLRITYKIT